MNFWDIFRGKPSVRFAYPTRLEHLVRKTPRLVELLTKIPKSWERDEFILMGSAALAFRGIRDVHDLDVLVTRSLYDTLNTKLLDVDRYGFTYADKLSEEDVDVFQEVPRLNLSFVTALAESDTFDGYRVMNLRHVLAIKAMIPAPGREKDYADMIAISRLISAERPKAKEPSTLSPYR
jgi:hypothetical protein